MAQRPIGTAEPGTARPDQDANSNKHERTEGGSYRKALRKDHEGCSLAFPAGAASHCSAGTAHAPGNFHKKGATALRGGQPAARLLHPCRSAFRRFAPPSAPKMLPQAQNGPQP